MGKDNEAYREYLPMQCPNCLRQNPSDSQFCQHCGARIGSAVVTTESRPLLSGGRGNRRPGIDRRFPGDLQVTGSRDPLAVRVLVLPREDGSPIIDQVDFSRNNRGVRFDRPPRRL